MIQLLEQMLELIPSVGAKRGEYTSIDVYTGGYSQMNNIPGHVSFCTCARCTAVAMGVNEKAYDLGQITGEQRLGGYGLTERYDSGHGNFHLNQDIININTGSTLINSGTSRKNKDGFKGLGLAHHIDLFKK